MASVLIEVDDIVEVFEVDEVAFCACRSLLDVAGVAVALVVVRDAVFIAVLLHLWEDVLDEHRLAAGAVILMFGLRCRQVDVALMLLRPTLDVEGIVSVVVEAMPV
eukprot:1936434-Amphidinium_carterae.2